MVYATLLFISYIFKWCTQVRTCLLDVIIATCCVVQDTLWFYFLVSSFYYESSAALGTRNVSLYACESESTQACMCAASSVTFICGKGQDDNVMH